ncbi:MAG: DivIVA domain-containing protein [Bacteroidia bacterium]|nr:DivIVA domain-containing protein [Bacteroidia bacterium]
MISPIEIRQYEFPKAFRGYSEEEVRTFLNSLSQEWERMLDDNRRLKTDLERTRASLESLKEVESILHKTLLQAEQSTKQAIEEAQKDAEMRIKKAESEAIAIMELARQERLQAASLAEELIADVKAEKQKIETEIAQLKAFRNNIVVELGVFLSSQLEQLSQFEVQEPEFQPAVVKNHSEPTPPVSFFETVLQREITPLIAQITNEL